MNENDKIGGPPPEGGIRVRALDHPAFSMTNKARKARGETIAPKKGQSPTNALTDAVIQYVQMKGGAARRVNVFGRYVEGDVHTNVLGQQHRTKGKYIPSGMKPGYEDIDCIAPITTNGQRFGLKVAVEVKTGRDALRPEQQERKAEVERCGGCYIIARDITQFMDAWDAIVSKFSTVNP